MTAGHIHAPSKRLPCCGRQVVPGDVQPGDVLVRFCCLREWHGSVKRSAVVDTVLIITWSTSNVCEPVPA